MSRFVFVQVPLGNKRKNLAYIVADSHSREAVAIDVGYRPEIVQANALAQGLEIKTVLATHRHQDHLAGYTYFKDANGAKLAAYKSVTGADICLDDGDVLEIGCVRIATVFTPGHTSDSICFVVNGSKLCTGDTLLVGALRSVSSIKAEAQRHFDSIHQRILTLPSHVEIWPGHEVNGKRRSTIGQERRSNPRLQNGFGAFIARQ